MAIKLGNLCISIRGKNIQWENMTKSLAIRIVKNNTESSVQHHLTYSAVQFPKPLNRHKSQRVSSCSWSMGLRTSWTNKINDMEHYKEICRNWHNLREGKEKKIVRQQHGVFQFGHPANKEPRKTGLNFLEQARANAVICEWWFQTDKILDFQILQDPGRESKALMSKMSQCVNE